MTDPETAGPPSRVIEIDARTRRWLDALDARHRQPFTSTEFLKAVRALSLRYVERRGELPRRSPIDSAGKRAAFAGFYAPLHFFAVLLIARALAARDQHVDAVLDLGCGTGVAGAAWILAAEGVDAARTPGRDPRGPGAPVAARTPALAGVDRDGWALDEARWNWRALGLGGRARRGDMCAALDAKTARPPAPAPRTLALAAWSANELAAPDRARLAASLRAHADRGGPVLIVEPISRRAAPWWEEWAALFAGERSRADDWAFDVDLPEPWNAVDEAAGFDRSVLSARSIYVVGR